MTTYYVGKTGSDSNDGSTWALRKLTIDAGVGLLSAGDTLYIGPGTYYEYVATNVAGSSGSIISIIGDVSGANTDGVGGAVVIDRSDDGENSETDYAHCFYYNGTGYLLIRGLTFRNASANCITTTSLQNSLTIEDCVCLNGESSAGNGIYVAYSGSYSPVITIQRCIMHGMIQIWCGTSGSSVGSGSVIKNCLLTAGYYWGVFLDNAGNMDVLNNTFHGLGTAIRVDSDSTNTDTVNIKYNIIHRCLTGIYLANTNQSAASDYNIMTPEVTTPYTNITAGTNDKEWGVAWKSAPMLQGHKLFYLPMMPVYYPGTPLHEWGRYSSITEDFFGRPRANTAAYDTGGAFIKPKVIHETGTTYSSTDMSIRINRTGSIQFIIPVYGGGSITVQVYSRMTVGYSGTKPQLIIKEPGQSDRTTTETGSTGVWNAMSDTWTLQSETRFITVVLKVQNATDNATYFDNLEIT